MKYKLLAVIMVSAFAAKAQNSWMQQSYEVDSILNSQSRKVTTCYKPVQVSDVPTSNIYIESNIASQVALDNTYNECEILVSYDLNCKGEAGNFMYEVSMREPRCKGMFVKVADYLNRLPSVEPVSENGKPIDVKISSLKITYKNITEGFRLAWYD